MTWTEREFDDDEPPSPPSGPLGWIVKLKEAYWPSPLPAASSDSGEPHVIPAERRRKVMRTMNPQEIKLAFGGFLLATIAAIAIPVYIIASNKVTKAGKNTISVAPDAKLLGGLILLFCVAGFFVLWKRWRTPVVVGLFFIGFAFTLFIGLIGFVFILLGGWLMLRAWRINKYGTTDTKLIRQEVSNRPRGKDARAAAPRSKTTSKSSAEPGARQASHREQALHAEGPAPKEDPQAHAVAGDGPWAGGRGGRSATGIDQERRAQQLQDVGAAAHERAGRGLLPQRPQHLDLGDHADHGGVDGQEEQTWVDAGAWCRHPSQPPGTTRPAAPAARGPGSSGSPPGGPAVDLAQQAQQLRLARRQPEDRAHHGLDPVPARAGPLQRRLQGQRTGRSALRAITASSTASFEGNQ